MNELASAQAAVAALRPVLSDITSGQLSWPTPCPGFDVAGLADHLVDTITMVRESAQADLTARFGEQRSSESARPDGRTEDSVLTRVTSAAESALSAWRRRGTDGDAIFAGRVLPAELALGVLSVELVVHGWDFAQALARPLPIVAAHSDFVLALARHIITPESRRTAGFDEPVAVTADAAALDRLVAYTGREPRNHSQTTDIRPELRVPRSTP